MGETFSDIFGWTVIGLQVILILFAAMGGLPWTIALSPTILVLLFGLWPYSLIIILFFWVFL